MKSLCSGPDYPGILGICPQASDTVEGPPKHQIKKKEKIIPDFDSLKLFWINKNIYHGRSVRYTALHRHTFPYDLSNYLRSKNRVIIKSSWRVPIAYLCPGVFNLMIWACLHCKYQELLYKCNTGYTSATKLKCKMSDIISIVVLYTFLCSIIPLCPSCRRQWNQLNSVCIQTSF